MVTVPFYVFSPQVIPCSVCTLYIPAPFCYITHVRRRGVELLGVCYKYV